MRIGIDAREFKYGTMTGIARYLDNFINFAVKANPEYRFFLYGNQDTCVHYDFPNLYISITPERNTIYWDQVVLAKLIKRDKIDVFLSPYIKGPYFAGASYVCTAHDVLFLILPEYWTPGRIFYNLAHIVFDRWVLSGARYVITDSENSRRDTMRILGVKSEKMKVIQIGISNRFRPVSNKERIGEVKAKYGISKKYVLHVGSFLPHKNVRRLILAYDSLPNGIKGTHQLVLAGKKDVYAQKLLDLSKKRGLQDRVIFTGAVSDDELVPLYCGAEVFVLPSLYEGFGLPALEAMACGAAVVASKSASLPEVAGDSAILVNPRSVAQIREGIERALTDLATRERLIAMGKERVKQFTVEKSVGAVLEVLERAADRR